MSNAFDKASLVMLPHAYEEGKLYSLKPTDRSGDFTFSRGADTATRVGEDGYIKKEHSNLLLQSNSFDTTWGGTGFYSLTSGQSGYDGSNDAWEFDKVAAGNNYITQSSLTNVGVVTASVYAKAGTASGVMIYTENGYGRWNLSTGTLINSGGLPIDSNIEDIGNGWYRCSVTSTSATNYYLKVVDTSGIDTTGSIYIQDAQLNQGLVATPYLETTTTPVFGGLTDNMPRLDYTDATCPSLLLEPSRTNLIANSEFRSVGTNSSVFNNSTSSPEGVSNACLFVENTALNVHGVQFSNTIPTNPSALDYTISVFAKAKERENIQISFYADSVSNNSSFFDIVNGTTSGDASTHKIEDYGNGWYRCSFTANVSQTTGSYNLVRFVMSNGSSGYYTGDGTSGLYMYGLQVEQGSYPTSYIPTYGSAQTRPADNLTSTPLSIDGLFGATSGSVFMEFTNPLQGLSNNWFYAISEDGAGKYMRVRNYWQFNFTYLTFDPSPNLGNLTNATKVAVKWGGGVIKLFTDGEEEAASTYTGGDINMNGTLTSLNGSFNFAKNDAKFKNIMFFPTALSDDECIALTTL